MKLITRFEAAARGTHELHGLYKQAFNAVAAAPAGSEDYRNALTSMKNIKDELACR